MTSTAERLQEARATIENARRAVQRDAGASPVLMAVVDEFARKADQASASGDRPVAIIELDQAGDSAKVAVEADRGVSPATRNAVLDAHLAVCLTKGELDV